MASEKREVVVQFKDFMDKRLPEISRALPKHMAGDRFLRTVLTAFSDPKAGALRECSAQSIYSSVLVAAAVGLEIGVLGQAYLVPYKGTCTFVPGWKGIVDVVNRTGKAAVRTACVFEGDEFDFNLGTSPFIKHKPCGEDNITKITHVYAIGEIVGMQDRIIEVWTNAKVKKHFVKYNKVGDKHYAHKNWEMYARKVPLLQVCKLLPQTVEVRDILIAANAAEAGHQVTVDETGRPIERPFEDDDGQPTTGGKSPITQPRRKHDTSQAVDASVKGEPKPLATEGQKKWLKAKFADDKALLAALKAVGLKRADWETLTLDGFNAVKDNL